MGWYVESDYQQYEVDQIQRIANLTNDWFLYQYAQKQRDYLEAKKKNAIVIPGSYTSKKVIPIEVRIKDSSPTYQGFGFENAFNGMPDKSYVAGIEGERIAYVTLELTKAVTLKEITIQWENITNFAKKVRLIALDTQDRKELAHEDIKKGDISHINLYQFQKMKKLRIEFSNFSGQSRILLRENPTKWIKR